MTFEIECIWILPITTEMIPRKCRHLDNLKWLDNGRIICQKNRLFPHLDKTHRSSRYLSHHDMWPFAFIVTLHSLCFSVLLSFFRHMTDKSDWYYGVELAMHCAIQRRWIARNPQLMILPNQLSSLYWTCMMIEDMMRYSDRRSYRMTSLSIFEPRFGWNRASPIVSINLGKIRSRFALFGRIESEQRDHIQIWIRRFWLAPSALCISYILWLFRSRLLLILPEWIASHRITLPSSSSALFASSGRLSTPSSTPSPAPSSRTARSAGISKSNVSVWTCFEV